ncbi:MAG: hypothetical protein IPP64_01230 [Bacteroidetes bacterium]|nr:hypothetical protein [Bacteroidota bacterium]
MKNLLPLTFGFLLILNFSFAQQVPAVEENIPFLVTFGKDGDKSWGDDDFSQTYFFVIPKFQVTPIYIRVFDAETSAEFDEKKGEYNTSTKFSVYGGKESFTNKDVRLKDPGGKYKSGNLLASKTFVSSDVYDGEWYTFGPFNPSEGELVPEYGGYIFKIIAEGISGDDGNLYKYFLSSSLTENKPIEGGNAFTFEYTFRLSDNQKDIAHLYPYVEQNVYSVRLSNFDFDNDGNVNIVSMAKKGELSKASGDNVWENTTHIIVEKEKKTTLDVQFIKNKNILIKNNNVTLYVTNQDGNLLPIYTVPIGGVPLKNSKIQFKQKKKTTPY